MPPNETTGNDVNSIDQVENLKREGIVEQDEMSKTAKYNTNSVISVSETTSPHSKKNVPTIAVTITTGVTPTAIHTLEETATYSTMVPSSVSTSNLVENLPKSATETPEKRKEKENPIDKINCCRRCTDAIVLTLENGFGRLGFLVSKHPIKTIIITLLVSGLCMIGVLNYYEEMKMEKLWVAKDSLSLKHQQWVKKHYPGRIRVVSVIAENDNILTPEGLSAICDLDAKIRSLRNGTDATLEQICLSLEKEGKVCASSAILLVWKNNCTHVKTLDRESIIQDVNKDIILSTGSKLRPEEVLGRIQYDTSGKITGAKATKMTYFLKNEVWLNGRKVDVGEWEIHFTRTMKHGFSGLANVMIFSDEGRTLEGNGSIEDDLVYLSAGYILIIVYLATMLGGFSRVNHKIWFAILTVIFIGLAVGIAYGLSSAFQLDVTPVHRILPFLLLGIGVDDVFVIVQNWENIERSSNKMLTTEQSISRAMRSAGVSILVTSFTDVCAFLIGATTILPALRSFCIFAGIGVLAVFLLTCTFFVALLSLDSKRQRDRRDACFCCIKLSDQWKPLACSTKSYLQEFMKTTYSKIILSTPGTIVVLGVWAGMLTCGGYGLSQLRQNFDPIWLVPHHTISRQFVEFNNKYFPSGGVRSSVYIGAIDYFGNQDKILRLSQLVNSNKYVVNGSTRSWYEQYRTWLQVSPYKQKLTAGGKIRTEKEFYEYLNEFLNTSLGETFHGDIRRSDDKLKRIKASRMTFTHATLADASIEINAMDSLQELVKSFNFHSFEAFAYTRFYIQWETNKIIAEELVRNLGLAGIVVFFVTLFLIANIWTSLMVLSCVVSTLVNIAGFMHFWGLTIDTVTTIQLVLAVGLTIDYSAHIGHCFMASRCGSRKERASEALRIIGPAVFHGGFSTFIAFICLAGSKSYVFTSFFRVFFLVVIFGIFHGLVYLPVILSLFGPQAYSDAEMAEEVKIKDKQKSTENNLDLDKAAAFEGRDNQGYASTCAA